jgi:hypothetical protein
MRARTIKRELLNTEIRSIIRRYTPELDALAVLALADELTKLLVDCCEYYRAPYVEETARLRAEKEHWVELYREMAPAVYSKPAPIASPWEG